MEKRIEKFIEKFVYIPAVLIPLMTVPQVVKIWTNKSAHDLSLITWITYLIGALTWMSYGFIKKEKPIILTSFTLATVEIFLIIGIIIYG